jgi:hypothetical protein
MPNSMVKKAAIVSAIAVSMPLAAAKVSSADPTDEMPVQIASLSRQAEQTMESLYGAQVELNGKVELQHIAEKTHTADTAGRDRAVEALTGYRNAVNRYVVAFYTGAYPRGLSLMLTAESPNQLISKLSTEHQVNGNLSAQMEQYHQAATVTEAAEKKSAESEAAARRATSKATAVYTAILTRQRRVLAQINDVHARQAAFITAQRLPPPEPDTSFSLSPVPSVPELSEFRIEDIFRANDPSFVAGRTVEQPAPGGTSTAVQAALTQLDTQYRGAGRPPVGSTARDW